AAGAVTTGPRESGHPTYVATSAAHASDDGSVPFAAYVAVAATILYSRPRTMKFPPSTKATGAFIAVYPAPGVKLALPPSTPRTPKTSSFACVVVGVAPELADVPVPDAALVRSAGIDERPDHSAAAATPGTPGAIAVQVTLIVSPETRPAFTCAQNPIV